ncbi:MAG: PepSY domain-containing protein [Porticoccaceae bacterium]
MTDLRVLPLLVAVLLSCGTASARDISHNEVLELRRSGALVPFEQLLKSVEARYPGARVLEVELDEDDGIYLYEIEILTRNSQVRELEIDASNGAILADELED